MAITRTQIAKQLLAQGGRTGFQGGGKDLGTASSKDFGFGNREARDEGAIRERMENIGKDRPSVVVPPPKPPKPKKTVKEKFIPPAVKFFNFLGNKLSTSKLGKLNNMLQRENYLRTLSPEEQVEALEDLAAIGIGTSNPMGITRNIDRGMKDKGFLGTGIGGGKFITDIDLGGPEAEAVLGEGYSKYQQEQRDRFTSDDKDGPQDPCLGPNPPAYCFVGIRSAAPVVEDTEYVNPLSKLTPRIAGSQFAAAGGGIASLEDMDREGFVLGGIAKGLKKAVRGIKKLAKSPIGKAALGFAALKYGGGFGGLKTKLFGTPGYYNIGSALHGSGVGKAIASNPGLLGKLGLTAGGGSMALTGKGVAAAIGIPSILAGLTTSQEDKDKFDIDSYYASGQTGDVEPFPRIAGSKFDFYGSRIASAEGGSTEEKEPVAKKTMPLLDMDGMEKDYREDGGFVPIGRMEKADDVPARLSKNEFVFTADAVRNAGEGDVDKGAEVMYNMMKNLESGGDVSEESQGLEGARKMFQTSQRLGEVI